MKPKAKDTPKYRQQRLAAIRAAATVFAEKGFHGASTRDIAEQFGIKQGSLYYYFESKEEALEEVCLYGIQKYAEHMDEIARSNKTFEARLLAVVTNHLTSYREKNEALKVHNNERLYLPEERRRRLKDVGSRYREQLQSILDDGIAKGAIRHTVDSHFAAQSVIGLCNALGELTVRDNNLSVFELVRNCTDLLLNGLVSGGKA
jgi:AcrR family transcriptional regulator